MEKKKYFAAAEPEDAAKALHDKAQDWFNTIESNGYLNKLKNCWLMYHGAYFDSDGHKILFSGEQGELLNLAVNHFRNIAQHILGMVTATRPSFQARSINTDYKSLVQTNLANNLLEYYMREKRLERYLKTAVEYAVVLGAGYIKMAWNSTRGDIYDYNEDLEVPIHQGDVEFSNLSPFDVVFDSTKESANEGDWVICRSWKNKFDIAAKFPEKEDEILSIETKSDIDRHIMVGSSYEETDDIAIYEFYHKRTESMPDGRYLLYLDQNTVLLDSPMPYRDLPVYRISSADILGTPYGYTAMFDLLPIQEAVNSLYSTVLSNQNAFGVQNIYVPRGADININALSTGLNIIEGNSQAGKPEPLNLTATAPEIFNFMQQLENKMETISGINSVARGNPESGVTAGNALALLQSQALQFISGLQQSYIFLIEDVGTGLVKMLQDFASVPRVAAIVGKSNKTEMKEFVGDDIGSINRVIVDVGNALSQCLAKDTPVLMFNGSIKMSQDIQVDDVIMGPDSGPRTVGRVNTGEEAMYAVHTKNKKNEFLYECNESHILSMKYCANDGRYGLKKGQIIDMSIKEYLSLSDRLKNLLMGYRVGVEFEDKPLNIPPYVLGLWLGDGDNATTRLTTIDPEIEQEWKDYAESIGIIVREYSNKPSESKMYKITSGQAHGKSDRNPMMNYLRGYDLINNKHLPPEYKINSRENRLELLAGFIDTDGSLAGETFIITQKSETLIDDLMYLVKSLGFRATKALRKETKSIFGQEAREYEIYSLTIGGNTWEIPTRLPRKQSKEVKKQKDWLNYGFEVKKKEVGTYYGFTLREEPHFVLGDFSVSHNTTAGRLQIADNLLQMQAITTVEQYFAVMNTGRIEAMTESVNNSVMLVRSENERLADGTNEVLALATDNHAFHIKEHAGVVADPDLRLDPELVERTLKHIQEHITLQRETDPDLLAMLGQQALGPAGGTPLSTPTPEGIESYKAGEQTPLQMPQAAGVQADGGPGMLPQPAEPAPVNDTRPLK